MPEEMKLDDVEVEEDGLGDLLDGLITAEPEEEPESPPQEAPESQQPEEKKADAEPEQEAAPVEQEPEEPEGQGEPEQEPVPTFKYRGKEYSLEDLRKDQELFNKVITGANQQSHYQELYERQKQEAEFLQQRVQQEAYERQQALIQAQRLAEAQQAQQQGGGLSPELVKGHYGKQLDQMVKEGWIEEDIKELYPNVAAGMLFLRDTLLTEVAALKQQVAGLMGYTQQQYSESTKSQVRNTINGIFNEIAAEGGIFEPLKNPQTRNEFIRELQATVNPEIKSIIENPNILRNLWVARNHQAILAAAEQQKQAAQQVAQQKRRLSAAEAPGSRAPVSPTKKGPLPGEEEGWADL